MLTLKRALGDLFDAVWPTVQGWRTTHASWIELGVKVEPELGGDNHLPAQGGEGFAQQLLVGVWAVNLGGIEERDTTLNRRSEQCNHLLFVGRRAVGKTHSHAAKPDGRDFQMAVSQFTLLHC
jgi:hypothetical protein